jgi:hypothetical protein
MSRKKLNKPELKTVVGKIKHIVRKLPGYVGSKNGKTYKAVQNTTHMGSSYAAMRKVRIKDGESS